MVTPLCQGSPLLDVPRAAARVQSQREEPWQGPAGPEDSGRWPLHVGKGVQDHG